MLTKYDIDNLMLDKIKTDYRNGEMPEDTPEGCPDCGSIDVEDEGMLCAECSAGRAEFRQDAEREEGYCATK